MNEYSRKITMQLCYELASLFNLYNKFPPQIWWRHILLPVDNGFKRQYIRGNCDPCHTLTSVKDACCPLSLQKMRINCNVTRKYGETN